MQRSHHSAMRRISAWCLAAIAIFAFAGCFETHDGAFAVTPSATTIAWSTDMGRYPPLTFNFRNDHDAAASNVKISLTFTVLSGHGFQGIGVEAISPLPSGVSGSGGTYTISSMAAVSTLAMQPKLALEPGTYRWTAKIDVGDRVNEFNEDNNTATCDITVAAATVPDVFDIATARPTAILADATMVTIKIPLTVTPTGAKAYMVAVDVYLRGSTRFTRTYITELPAGTTTVEVTGELPAGATGVYEIDVDPFDYIPEDRTDNNLQVINFPWTASG